MIDAASKRQFLAVPGPLHRKVERLEYDRKTVIREVLW